MKKNHLVALAHRFGGTSLLSHTKICTNPKTPIMHLQMCTRHVMYAFFNGKPGTFFGAGKDL
jgi:hypothetical protein